MFISFCLLVVNLSKIYNQIPQQTLSAYSYLLPIAVAESAAAEAMGSQRDGETGEALKAER